MELEYSTRSPGAEWEIFKDPSLTNPICHQSSNRQRSWNWSPLKVLALASIIFWDVCDGDIEASKASQTAKDEECEEEMIDRCAESNSECSDSWRKPEGNLTSYVSHMPISIYIDVCTKSARESSSCPIRLLFFLHLATFPSMKSKNRPNGMNAKAYQRFACAD